MHPIFGAFIAGVVVPREARTRELLLPKLEVACAVLLPLFFAATGIRTHIQLLGSAGGWLVCAAVIATATLGKMGGSAAAARLTGSSWREAYMIGALMNTRGLMELVVLNLGYDLGIMSPALFSVMVMMALVTTAATSPLLRLAEGSGRRARAPLPAPENF
jgi:Kef-type K+ transport system membrane component KefB